MNNSKEKINVPDYIEDEYQEYIKSDKSSIKWQNLNSLINLAKISGRVTEEEANILKEQYK